MHDRIYRIVELFLHRTVETVLGSFSPGAGCHHSVDQRNFSAFSAATARA